MCFTIFFFIDTAVWELLFVHVHHVEHILYTKCSKRFIARIFIIILSRYDHGSYTIFSRKSKDAPAV